MASLLTLKLPLSLYLISFGSVNRARITVNLPHSSNLNLKDATSNVLYIHSGFSRRFCSAALSSLGSSACTDDTNSGNGHPLVTTHSHDMEFNKVNCLVWVLHESSRSFSLMIQSLELAQSSPELAMAWAGVDVHAWHKQLAHKVAVYALLRSAMDVVQSLSREHRSNTCPVSGLLSPKTDLLAEYIESQVKMMHPELVQWFRMVELPRVAGFFIPLLKKWLLEHEESGIAGISVAISCCAAVRKLGSRRLSSPSFTFSIDEVLSGLMNLSSILVSMEKLLELATEAGFEEELLFHFGSKVFPSNKNQEVEFWVGLALNKLSVAFQRESLTSKQIFLDKVQKNSLATLGLFAYLGRRTRIFLSGLGINDLDEQVMDFLSYLECGCLFIYPQLSSLSVYQSFMEVVIDEIGWLDLYAASSPCINNREKRRSKHQTIQAEKEIILSTVFTICYDVFCGFAHFSNSTQQPMDADLLAFLLRSQSLLTICLEDYWAAYDRSGELLKLAGKGACDLTASLEIKGTKGASIILEADDTMERGRPESGLPYGSVLSRHCLEWRAMYSAKEKSSLVDGSCAESKPLHESLLRKSSMQLISTSSDIWMGTQLLFIDIMLAMDVLMKQLHGHKITNRERKKIRRTLADIASLIPITILMLLPVSAVGHAAMFAAIKKYTPSLIPSSYSSERLDVVKQLKRTKKMEVESWSSIEDTSSAV